MRSIIPKLQSLFRHLKPRKALYLSEMSSSARIRYKNHFEANLAGLPKSTYEYKVYSINVNGGSRGAFEFDEEFLPLARKIVLFCNIFAALRLLPDHYCLPINDKYVSGYNNPDEK